MSKKQLCIEFLRVLSAFCIHYMVILSPLMLIAAFLFVDNVIHSHPTLLKTILTFFFVDIAEMALAWNLRHPEIACVLVGASRPAQLVDDVKALDNLQFSADELTEIDHVLDGN